MYFMGLLYAEAARISASETVRAAIEIVFLGVQ
jgi:hypothetical protein